MCIVNFRMEMNAEVLPSSRPSRCQGLSCGTGSAPEVLLRRPSKATAVVQSRALDLTTLEIFVCRLHRHDSLVILVSWPWISIYSSALLRLGYFSGRMAGLIWIFF